MHSKGENLVAECKGFVEFAIPREAELETGKRPTVRVPYGSERTQVWELGEPKTIPNSSAVVIMVATVDGKPGDGRCVANSYGTETVGFNCSSYVAAVGAAGDNAFSVQYSNAPNGGTATGSAREVLDYVVGLSVLLGGQPPPSRSSPPAIPNRSSA